MGLKKDIPDSIRMNIMQFLLVSCKSGRPAYGRLTEAAGKFDVSISAVRKLWATAKAQKNRGEVINVSSIRNKRIRKYKHEINYETIEQIPHAKRGTIQAMADALKLPKSTVGRWVKGRLLRPHTNHIKSLLTASNMLERLSFSLQATHYDRCLNILKFKPMENTVHIDEKWFFLTRSTARYYLTPVEANPHRVCKSKNFLPKVMFMCAVSRPVFGEDGTVLFDGKIGIWPFIEEVTAQRDSIYRKRGTKEMKPMQSINRKVIKGCIMNQIVPAIKEKWPSCLSKNISIQQDNARPHIQNRDQDFQAVANADGFHIKLIRQPPNSPDCNALDLGFFCAIQSLQQRQKCKTSDELIQAMKFSFMSTDPMTLNKVFLTLQCVLEEIMKQKGKNNFNPPHMKKNAQLRQGVLPTNLEVPQYLVRESIDHLIREEHTEGIEDLMAEMEISAPQSGSGVLDLNM